MQSPTVQFPMSTASSWMWESSKLCDVLKTVPAVNKARQNAREITAKDILMIHFDFLTSPRPVEDLSCTNSLRDLIWVANQKYKKYYLMSNWFVELQNPFPLRPNVTPNTFCLIDCVYFPEKITHKRGAFRNSKNCVVTNFYYLFAMSHSFHYRAHQIKTT